MKIVCLLLLVPALAFAAPARSIEVDVQPAGWRAEALATALKTDLVDDRLKLAKADADLRVELVIEEAQIRYHVAALWPGAPPPRIGTIAIGGSRAAFAAKLRDELHGLARVTIDERVAPAVMPPPLPIVLIGCAVATLVMLAPFLVRRRVPIGVATIAGACVLVIFARMSSALWLGLGGLAWGTFVVTTMPIVFPPIIGFGRIEQGELGRVLSAWVAAVGRRALAASLLYVPIALVAWWFGDVVIVALVLLAARMTVRGVIAVIALELDARLIDTTANRSAWEAATRAYVIGYVHRARLDVDRDLLARVQLVPSTGDEVVAYGGGLAASRIAIPRRMLELALAPWGRPHDYAAPRVSTLHWTEWNAGLLMPTEIEDDKIATAEQRQPKPFTAEGEADREVLGEPPTLAGTVEPAALDPQPSAYRPHDDPMWLEWDSGDDDDGTDAGDRDFLFGAIMYALAAIQRHDDRLATFALRWPRLRRREPAIGDYHTALAGARHHLVQYLGFRKWKREDLLTARAFAPELEAATRRVVTVAAGTDARISRLADPDHVTAFRRLVLATTIVACVAAIGIAVVSAVRYHASFVEETTHGQN
jgi:hypothetical protein